MYMQQPSWGPGSGVDEEARRLLSNLSARLEAHVRSAGAELAALRGEVRELRGGGAGRGTTEAAYDLRARLSRLEAEVAGFPRSRGSVASPSGIFSGLFTAAGSPGIDGDLMMVVEKPESAAMLGAGWQSSLGSWGAGAPPVPRAPRTRPVPELPDSVGTDVALDAVVGLESSIWDCALVIILHQGCAASKDPRQQWYLGSLNIVLTWALLFFNLVVQVLFIIAVDSMSAPDPFTEILPSMRDDRLMTGQVFEEMDKKTMTTRTERTCNNQVYDSLTRTISGLSTYLRLDADKGVLALPGYAICFLAMLFWVIEMTVELRRCADLLLVVIQLPLHSCTLIEESGSCHIVKGVTRWNKMLSILFVLAPRFAISFFLLVFGKRFLAGTVDISELILNTCALEFVRNVDDMIFEAMATRSLILFTKTAKIFRTDALSQQPLLDDSSEHDFTLTGYIPPGVPRRGGWPAEIFNVLFSIAFVAVQSYQGYVGLIQPFVNSAHEVYSSVCGENTRFTYLFHPVTQTPIFSQADQSAEHMIHLRCFYVAQYEMVRIRAGFLPQSFPSNATLAMLINGSHPLCQAPFGEEPPLACPERELMGLSAIALMREEGYYASPSCRDQDVAFAVLRETCLSGAFFNASHLELGFFRDAHSCADLRRRCQATANYNISLAWFSKLQNICPGTCRLCTSSEVVATPDARL